MKSRAKKLGLAFVKNADPETAAEQLLLVLGFQTRLKGTRYLSEAIALKYCDEKQSCADIYNSIATKHNTTPVNVERTVRHALKNCRNEGSITDFNRFVGCNAIDRKFDTTNSEFISVISKWLRWVREDKK